MVSALCFSIVVGTAEAISLTYADQRKPIKAGVLVLDADAQVNIPAAFYTFYIMGWRQDVKPAGWDFYNPIAPTNVTSQIKDSRWAQQYKSNPSVPLGAPVTKNMACYWEVVLPNATSDDIAQFDVLLLPGYGVMKFSPGDKEKLRRFVDNGGVLWIENWGSAQFDLTQPFFISGLGFSGLASRPISVAPAAMAHSLVNRPFTLSASDILKIGRGATGQVGLNSFSGNEPSYYFATILLAEGKPVVSVAQYGSGHIVIVGHSVSQAISLPVGAVQAGAFCGGRFMAADLEDLRFAYNIVSLGTEHKSFQKNARHPGYSFSEIGAPLATYWEYRTPGAPAPTLSSPAILDDLVFYVDGRGTLHAFELSPTRDRDGNGDPDDGIDDPPIASYDELWAVNVGIASPPTAAYVPVSNGIAIPVVFVTTETGQTVYVRVDNPTPQDCFSQTVNPFSYKNPDGVPVIPSPTYVDGWIFAVDGKGYLHAKSFFGGGEWTQPVPSAQPLQIETPMHSPTVGYFHDPSSGATEQVVYVAERGIKAIKDGAILSYPIKVFNEALVRESSDGRPQVVNEGYLFGTRSRARIPILYPSPVFRLYYLRDINGDGIKEVQDITSAVGTNVLVNSDGQTPNSRIGYLWVKRDWYRDVLESPTLILDYELDYSTAQAQMVQPRIRIGVKHPTHQPGNPLEGSGLECAPAVSKKDLFYYSAENGSLYCIRESSRGGSPLTMKWRWFPADPPAAAALGTTTALPFGSPAVSGDMVYFALNDSNNQGIIAAFKADPEFSISLGEPIRRGTSVIVEQRDTMSPSDPNPMALRSGVSDEADRIPSNAPFVIDYDTGKLSFYNFKSGNSEITVSQGVRVTYTPANAASDQPVTVDRGTGPGDKWNNLVWSIRLQRPGGGPLRITSSPMMMGDVLYVGCEGGILVSLDVGELNRRFKGPSAKVMWQFGVPPQNPNAGYTGNPPVPILYAAPVMGDVYPLYSSVAGSHGMLAVSTAEGLTVLHNPATLIADANRLVEMDASGRVLWACDTTYNITATAGGPGGDTIGAMKVPFNRPAVVRRAPVGGLVVCDTGNNRIVHIDTSGGILWQITGFADPGKLLPSGASLTLNRPTDVTMWMEQVPNSLYPIYHYLIADSGNHRILQVSAEYDPVAQKYVNNLKWVSLPSINGKKYDFSCARFIPDPDQTWPYPALVCVVTNEVQEGNLIAPGGALLMINYWKAPVDGNPPDETYTAYTRLPLVPNPDPNKPIIKLTSPTFYTRYYKSRDEFTELVIDSNTIYVMDYTNGGADYTARTPFTPRDYAAQSNGNRFAPTYAQILPNGNILVTNKALSPLGQSKGEVFEMAYDPVSGGWVINAQRIGDADDKNSHGLRQPSSAERETF